MLELIFFNFELVYIFTERDRRKLAVTASPPPVLIKYQSIVYPDENSKDVKGRRRHRYWKESYNFLSYCLSAWTYGIHLMKSFIAYYKSQIHFKRNARRDNCLQYILPQNETTIKNKITNLDKLYTIFRKI